MHLPDVFPYMVYNNLYSGESKVLQYFDNVNHNLPVSDSLLEVVKVTKHTGWCDAELA